MQDIDHLLELKFGLRRERDHLILERIFGSGSLEVESCGDFTVRLIDAVFCFVCVEVADYIERGHNAACSSYCVAKGTPVHRFAPDPVTISLLNVNSLPR